MPTQAAARRRRRRAGPCHRPHPGGSALPPAPPHPRQRAPPLTTAPAPSLASNNFLPPAARLPPAHAGTVPIVSHTGGLADTVRDVADNGVPEHERNGFVFSGAPRGGRRRRRCGARAAARTCGACLSPSHAFADVPTARPPASCAQGREEHKVAAAVHRALDAFYDGHAWWRGDLVPRAMRQDWSWSRSAQDYLELYRSCLQ